MVPLISVIIGTRPEAIKLAPVILELKKYPKIRTKVILSGQHLEIVNEVLDLFQKKGLQLNIMKSVNLLTKLT